jgi:hypothetical protein
MTNLKILGAVVIAASALCSRSPALAQWYVSNPAASEDQFGNTIGHPSYGPHTGGYYHRRTVYRHPAAVAAGVTGAAVGTAAAVAATSPWAGGPYYGGAGYYGGGPYYTAGYAGSPYHGARVRGAMAAIPSASCSTGEGCAGQSANWNLVTAYRTGGPFYGFSGWADYKTRNGIACDPGTPGCQ